MEYFTCKSEQPRGARDNRPCDFGTFLPEAYRMLFHCTASLSVLPSASASVRCPRSPFTELISLRQE